MGDGNSQNGISASDRACADKDCALKHPAVFPELPSPLKNIYVRVRDLNKSDSPSAAAVSAAEEGLDRRERLAFEVGVRFSF